MLMIQFDSPIFILVAILVLLRAAYHLRAPHFTSFALACTVIIFEFLGSLCVFFQPTHIFLTMNPYKPLLLASCTFILFIWIYRLLNAQWLHNFARKHFPTIIYWSEIYGREILIATELIASLLAYKTLSEFPEFKSWLLTYSQAPNNGYDHVGFALIVTLIGVRFIWNSLLGSYKTFVFWALVIITMFVSAILGQATYFPAYVFLFVYAVMYIFRFVCTEENFYHFFAKTKLSETRFAMLVHGAAALSELLASLMIAGLFIHSYADLAIIKAYF